ncbi:hypothetical protein [Companilactobacillus mishanensis]|uniref:Helix-turn-helix domain-containing protein n=1 Tax=Companilactobacillus mishanensis TaxID=2486008 RepID=A0A5P0ZGK1_9LACO|nr:hypothetical protein [Companilactobacillus mishanensis]MQS52139.1 helix-turn-helix domain-containing protein [Companilactobacillus mishanensis]
MQVILSDEQKQELQSYIYEMVTGAVAKGSSTNKTWLKKFEACKYANVSNPTFDQFIIEGLPRHNIGGVTLYNKDEIDEFILNK